MAKPAVQTTIPETDPGIRHAKGGWGKFGRIALCGETTGWTVSARNPDELSCATCIGMLVAERLQAKRSNENRT